MNARHRLGAALVLVLGLLGLTGCAASGEGGAPADATGNMVSDRPVAAPKHPRWFSGQLVVEPAGAGRACLLLDTDDGSYVLRTARTHLEIRAWQRDGAFDATRSGVVANGRVVAPYGDELTSIRGRVVADADGECDTHPTLSVARAVRGERSMPESTPDPSLAGHPDAGAGGSGPLLAEPAVRWMKGELTVVRGNQRDGYCLAIDTAAGAYTLGSSSKAYDVVVSEVEGGVDRRRTGIHHHGRDPLGMYASVGQQVELLGRLYGDNTDFHCSSYYSFSITDVAP
ncbi:hypothetical protein [Nocardioides sp. 503]|uniref:hypothetical protein n=1 Tax=Nocardioides sp. 503 TaxID=2508326 RepID=UPI00106FEEC0|nr:hypothetical protein [Nocardioides sp. 503]